MAFINEYISNEDIEKYQIDAVMNSYREREKFPDEYYKHRWTIDKERGVWFMWVDTPKDPLDYTRYTGERIFILHIHGQNIEIVLKKVFDESSEQLTDNPFYVTWKLEKINKPESLKHISDQEIIHVLKEALDIYGTRGIKSSVPQENFIVKLKTEEK